MDIHCHEDPYIPETTPQDPKEGGEFVPSWLTDLVENGYAVVPDVLSKEKCNTYYNRIWQIFEDFGTGVDRSKPETWKSQSMPANIHGIFQHYKMGHKQPIWDIRCEPAIINVFKQIWGTEELLVSFDGLNLTKPSHRVHSWEHVDQKPGRSIPDASIAKRMKDLGFSKDFCCIQGLLALTDSGKSDGGFISYKGSHKLHASFFKSKENPSAVKDDWYKFQQKELKYFKGCERVKVCCNVGDMILWDSRVVHCNEAPHTPRPRMAVYVSYQPKSFATPKVLQKKRDAFLNLRMTTHWAATKVKLFPEKPRTYGNEELITKFPVDNVPIPTLNDIGKKLAGIIPY